MLSIKGHEIQHVAVRDSPQRKAVQFQNKIITVLKKLDLTEDDIEIELERVAIKRAPAAVSWFFNGYYLHYSYQGFTFVENLCIVFKVIEKEVDLLLQGKKTMDEFIAEFTEDKDILKQRKEAREILGVDENCIDLDVIDKRFKELSKKLHPDMDGGDLEQFKTINRAHKILRRELG